MKILRILFIHNLNGEVHEFVVMEIFIIFLSTRKFYLNFGFYEVFLPQIWHSKSSMELSLFTYFSMDFTSFKVTSKCAFFDNHFLQKRATFQSIINFLLLILFMKTYYEK